MRHQTLRNVDAVDVGDKMAARAVVIGCKSKRCHGGAKFGAADADIDHIAEARGFCGLVVFQPVPDICQGAALNLAASRASSSISSHLPMATRASGATQLPPAQTTLESDR